MLMASPFLSAEPVGHERDSNLIRGGRECVEHAGRDPSGRQRQLHRGGPPSLHSAPVLDWAGHQLLLVSIGWL